MTFDEAVERKRNDPEFCRLVDGLEAAMQHFGVSVVRSALELADIQRCRKEGLAR